MIQFIQGLLRIWKEEWMNILPKEKNVPNILKGKHLPKSEKEDIIKHNKNITVLSEKLDITSYKRIRLKR